jgi:hypothetical protein
MVWKNHGPGGCCCGGGNNPNQCYTYFTALKRIDLQPTITTNDYVQWGAPPNIAGPFPVDWGNVSTDNFSDGVWSSSPIGEKSIPGTEITHEVGVDNLLSIEWGLTYVSMTCSSNTEVTLQIWTDRLGTNFHTSTTQPPKPWPLYPFLLGRAGIRIRYDGAFASQLLLNAQNTFVDIGGTTSIDAGWELLVDIVLI